MELFGSMDQGGYPPLGGYLPVKFTHLPRKKFMSQRHEIGNLVTSPNH